MSSRGGEAIAVLGAGSWGTALALVLARNGLEVRLWGHDPAEVAALQQDGENRQFLPGFPFPGTLSPVPALEDAVRGANDLLVVVPSHGFHDCIRALKPLIDPATRILWATKGLEARSGGLLHTVVEQELPGHVMGVLSGPSFAREVAQALPTAVTIASSDSRFASDMAEAFHNASFRPYTSQDIVGVQLGGAVKNVLAVATGIADGLGLGANTRAGLITRGLAEIVRLGNAMGADQRTFMGLSGVGDLILTCTDDQSRNRRFGLALGRGQAHDTAMREIGQVVEGVRTAAEVHALARQQAVEMPICEQVYAVVSGKANPRDALEQLMARARKEEFGPEPD